MKYLNERRKALGGFVHGAVRRQKRFRRCPSSRPFDALLKGSGEGREISTTMAFVRVLTALVRDKELGRHIVPIVPDGHAPSAWKACSASSASSRPKARSTSRSTKTR